MFIVDAVQINLHCTTKDHVLADCQMTWGVLVGRIDSGANGPSDCI